MRAGEDYRAEVDELVISGKGSGIGYIGRGCVNSKGWPKVLRRDAFEKLKMKKSFCSLPARSEGRAV